MAIDLTNPAVYSALLAPNWAEDSNPSNSRELKTQSELPPQIKAVGSTRGNAPGAAAVVSVENVANAAIVAGLKKKDTLLPHYKPLNESGQKHFMAQMPTWLSYWLFPNPKIMYFIFMSIKKDLKR